MKCVLIFTEVKLGTYCFGPKSCVPNALCKQYGSGDIFKCSCLEGFYDDDFNNTNVGGSCDSGLFDTDTQFDKCSPNRAKK